MQIVIDIDKDLYEGIERRDGELETEYVCDELMKAVDNGTPLPKGHKRLIEDNFEVGPVFDEEGNRVGYRYVTQAELNNALTIIEADKEVQE
jgi:hypothetical protein